jgi:hypothetical protein
MELMHGGSHAWRVLVAIALAPLALLRAKDHRWRTRVRSTLHSLSCMQP